VETIVLRWPLSGQRPVEELTLCDDRGQTVVDELLGHLVTGGIHWHVRQQLLHQLLDLLQEARPLRTILNTHNCNDNNNVTISSLSISLEKGRLMAKQKTN